MNCKSIYALFIALTIALYVGLSTAAFCQVEDPITIPKDLPWTLLGYSVSGDYDLDGDNVPDFIIGGPYIQASTGRVWIFSGADGTVICMLDGETAGDKFGYSVSWSGDLDNNGSTDFIIGAPFAKTDDDTVGKAYIYSGETFSLIHFFEGVANNERLGHSVSWAGDVNNDGNDDIIIGSPGWDSGRGKAVVYLAGTWDPVCIITGDSYGDSMGFSVSGAGDVRNDGKDYVIAGAPYYDGNVITDKGRARVYCANPCQLECTLGGDSHNELFGFSVSGAGDVNYDGWDDLIVGAPGWDSNRGKARVVSGRTCLQLHTFPGEAEGDYFGWSVSGAGYINSGPEADLLVGAPGANSDRGKAYVFLGSTWQTHSTFNGEGSGDMLGFSVSAAGDIEIQDGTDDVIIGAPRADHNVNIPGNAYVYSGLDESKIFDFFPVYPNIEITSPADGQILDADSQYNMEWISSFVDFFPYVKMKYSLDNGVTWSEWIEDIPNTGTHIWDVPDTCAESCQIVMCPSTHCLFGCDTSGCFCINKIIVEYPVGGEVWCIGDPVCVNWNPCCSSDSIRIELSTNSGSTWDTVLVDSTANDGEFCFVCPNTPSQNCRIRLSDPVSDSILDVSDSDFIITSTVNSTVIFPNGGEVLCAGWKKIITWDPGCFTDRVDIEYSLNGGYDWESAPNGSNTSNDGLLVWYIPETHSFACLIRVCHTGGGPCDESDSYFSILQCRSINEEPLTAPTPYVTEEGEKAASSVDFSLSENHPNPFNPQTEISYDLPNAGQVVLSIHNLLGQRIKTLVDEFQAAGHKTIRWDGTDDEGNQVASGIYFYRIQAGDFVDSKKMILMK